MSERKVRIRAREDGVVRISIRMDEAAANFYRKEAQKVNRSLNAYLNEMIGAGAFIGQQKSFLEEIDKSVEEIKSFKMNDFYSQFWLAESLFFCEEAIKGIGVADVDALKPVAEKKVVDFARKPKSDINFVNGVPEDILLALFFCEAVCALYQNSLSREKYELAVKLAHRKAGKFLQNSPSNSASTGK